MQFDTHKPRSDPYSNVEDLDIISINIIYNILRETFSPYRTLEQYKAELTNIFMRKDERILDYIDKVKHLHRAIMNEERYRTNELRENKKFEITLTSFCDGLPFEYNIRIVSNACNDLANVFAKVRLWYKRIEHDKLRRHKDERRRDAPTYSKQIRNEIRERGNVHTGTTLLEILILYHKTTLIIPSILPKHVDTANVMGKRSMNAGNSSGI
ncbi:enzymatic polyprotein endonuclease reverse [Vespula squamosa]|uniref:Enzymatic polyprotein endonuclease reverse n=1 Tax=Vespula squamosa TaxID=30214 RepID=A0ABD1ZZF9_VESSQ